MLEANPRSTPADTPGRSPPLTAAGSSSRDVSFTATAGSRCCSDFSLTIEAGQKVALVGPTGAGKSTIAALVPRLMDPQRGPVLGSTASTCAELTSWPRCAAQIALVLQDCVLLHGTLRENIDLRPARAPRDARGAAGGAAGAGRRVRRPAAGRAGHAGRRARREPVRRPAAAGGDRQGDPAGRADPGARRTTSALDALSEQLIVRALEQLPAGPHDAGHRAPAVDGAQGGPGRVIENGRIVEVGPPAQLLRNNGKYAEFVGAQHTTMWPTSGPAMQGVAK